MIHARQSLAGKGYEQKSLMKADPTFTVDDMANEFVHISYRPDTDEVRIGMYLFPVCLARSTSSRSWSWPSVIICGIGANESTRKGPGWGLSVPVTMVPGTADRSTTVT